MHIADNILPSPATNGNGAVAGDYLTRAAKKRALQASKIPESWRLTPVPSVEDAADALHYLRTSGKLTQEELEITETTDATTLLGKLASGELSSVQVVNAFSKRAAIAHQLTTCCTEIFFEEALEDAKRLDETFARTGKLVGPLHGLPISIKDSVDVKGQDTSVGRLLFTSHRLRLVIKRNTDSCRQDGSVWSTSQPSEMQAQRECCAD
jgi:amidase